MENSRSGVIQKSTGSWYFIKDLSSGEVYEGRIRGKFKMDNIRNTNPVAVGDVVDFELEKNDVAWITNIHTRKNYLIRKSVNLSKATHIIASNIDIACILFTVKDPQTSLGFLNRFLITCEAYQVRPLIIFNKMDVLNDDEVEEKEYIQNIYEKIGYETLSISAKENIGIDALIKIIQDKVCVLFGHSGAGKSTTVNTIQPDLDLKVKEVSSYNDKGKHTTTFAQMYDWSFGGSIIDIPGIKEFELVDISKDELQDYFPEIFAKKENCKFNNCLHINEPNCGVKQAMEEGQISKERYQNYTKIVLE